MSSNHVFISVLSAPVCDTDIEINIETFNAEDNISLTATITGIDSDMDEEELAREIFTQLKSTLTSNDCIFDGNAAFTDESYQATFRVTRTEHCIAIWSQALFKVKIVTNETQAILRVGGSPVFCTIQQARDWMAVYNIKLKSSGAALTDQQLAHLLALTSAQLCSRLNNYVIWCTYLKEFNTRDTKGVRLSPTPVIDFDLPRIRRRGSVDLLVIPGWQKDAYGLIHETGRFNQRFYEVIMDIEETNAEGNFVYITFESGYNEIPEEIQAAIVQMCDVVVNKIDKFEKLAGGSFEVVLGKNTNIWISIFAPIARYKSK